MNSKRVYLLMLAVIGVLIIAILGGAYGAKDVLAKKSSQLVQLKADLQGYQLQEAGLTQAKKQITTYSELYQIAKAVVPENKNQAETVLQIVKLAGNNSITLGTITFPNSTLGNGAGGTAAVAPKTTLGTPTKTVTIGNPDLSQLTPVTGSAGVYVLQITIASDPTQPASYDQLISFLSDLERNRLTAEVTSVNIVPDTTLVNRFSFTLSLNSYIKP